jgi:hypothetical protein
MLSELGDCVPSDRHVEQTVEEKELSGYISDWLDSLSAEDCALFVRRYWFGDAVQLLDCEVRSNATTEQMGEVVKHTVGDYHALYLTVSKNLETYYEQRAEVPLLESLEQTMTGYSGRTYQEYHLILE